MLDPNRNCQLSTRGFEKGGELIKTHIGKQNSWGLVNYVGNVQEWVYDSGRKLVAVGGSYLQAMESCDINTKQAHSGEADQATGLRVVRELRVENE
jgi:formylglycine-generating enzyme required for sulfatase activity